MQLDNQTLKAPQGGLLQITAGIQIVAENNLDGDSGKDQLSSGSGSDTLNGGVGSDTYLFGKGGGQDTIYSGRPQNSEKIVR